MTTDIKGKEQRIRELQEQIIDSVNKRVTERTELYSAREKNLLLNDFEYSMGKISLESTPEGVGLGAHYGCNARCIFCLEGKPKLFSLERYKEFFEPRLGSVISKARYVNFCGFGELLLMPEIEKFVDYVNEKIPNVNKLYTTNGTPLMNNELLSVLTKTKSVVEISLHASTSQLHKLLTRMNTFDQIVRQIRQLVSVRKCPGFPTVSLIFLINTLNIENLPLFVEFASGLGADEVICNYMTIFDAGHLKFSCFFKQEITNACFERAEERAKELNFSLKLPPRFGVNPVRERSSVTGYADGGIKPLSDSLYSPPTLSVAFSNGVNNRQDGKVPLCSDPWKYFYVENEGSVLACCYAGDHFGYLDRADFETIWNGANYKYLRKSLTEGPPHEWCRYCLKYSPTNVNDIRSHINFRPGFREKILGRRCK